MPSKIPILDQIAKNMVFIAGGSYGMGEEQRHQVTVPDFYMSRYPVTVEDYLAFVEATNTNHPEWMEKDNSYNIYTGTDDHYKKLGAAITHPKHPILGVRWQNAVAFCEWLQQQTGEPYRLPSEAQWEYAARGGQQSKDFLYAGSHNLKEVGWYDSNSHGETKPVGLKKANELGLYDMSGNVWEWCADEWQEDLTKVPKDGSPAKGDNSAFVVRGGSWNFNDLDCAVSLRFRISSDYRDYDIGIRVSRY